MYGWAGKILEVDLSGERITEVGLDEELARDLIGGRGLGVRLLYDRVRHDVGPFDPDNLLVFATGPLTGTLAPTSGRHCVVTKSPLTGTIFDANSGGNWGAELKFAGVDAIVIKGQAREPVYLWVHDGEAELRDASDIWGMGTHATTDAICRQVGNSRARVACIGPAGERLVRIAAIVNDKHRAAGRGGVGAVMGSKLLKAIAVRGSGRPKIADEGSFDVCVRECQKLLREDPITGTALPTCGTAVLVNIINEHGIYPTRNFRAGVFPTADKTSGETIAETTLVRNRGCFGCPIACGRVTKVGDVEGEGPEYGTIWAFGAQCGVDDLAAIAEANLLCNDLGLDTISMGSTIGCAMELGERGKLDGPKFGDARAIVDLTRATGVREGIGDELAEGSARLAGGRGLPELSMSVKGLELPAYDPRGAQGQGLAYATSNRGGCHLRAYMIAPEILGAPKLMERFSASDKAEMTIILQDLSAAVDSLVLCRFTTFALGAVQYAKLLTAATGIEFTDEDIMTVGERIWNLERLYNIREGLGAKDDVLPKRLAEEPMPEGPSRGRRSMVASMLPSYYASRGWDSSGVPTEEKLRQLGLLEF
ncbi:MAG: aldehyde ferredoxin oxidoreductase family protein [Candidatus Hodarchaeaceae archaeon]|nr:aldehyde ferredoxin oxidoreductase family protein [Candidatus Hodarchaeaceae archaeon]